MVSIEFYNTLLSKQQINETVPSNEKIAKWAEHLLCLLYPELSKCKFTSITEIENEFKLLEGELVKILIGTTACRDCNNEWVAAQFFKHLPSLFSLLNDDIEAITNGDPAAHSKFEVIRAYPGFYALCFYRIAHALHQLQVPLLPRILTEYAHSKTGVDIHPAAKIGRHFFIDHGTGIVIGETAVIGNYVKLYQGVTLGALSVAKSMAFTKRHPTVEDRVVIYSGATILGGDTVIGHDSVIGGNVWLTKSVAPGSLVYHNPDIIIVEGSLLTEKL